MVTTSKDKCPGFPLGREPSSFQQFEPALYIASRRIQAASSARPTPVFRVPARGYDEPATVVNLREFGAVAFGFVLGDFSGLSHRRTTISLRLSVGIKRCST